MFKFMTHGNIGVEVAEYVFHDPPVDGKRMMRATTAGYLLSTGELFIGCSCASEGDQFTRAQGRQQATAAAMEKLINWKRGGKCEPDAKIFVGAIEDGSPQEIDPKEINKDVYLNCLEYQVETFRLILFDRHAIIESLSLSLAR